jgi:DNA polymerase I-like protein with 3'-5' exonuclease and polymerase domains
MYLVADYKHLEIDAAFWMSNEKRGKDELRTGYDIHSDNQRRLDLPTRLVAKTFVFRILYGGSAAAFTIDPEFANISRDEEFWNTRIENFYSKYPDLGRWHSRLMHDIVRNRGTIWTPSGRMLCIPPEGGEYKRTKVLNYPVQSFAADIMMVARIKATRNIEDEFCGTIHDSLIFKTEKPQEVGQKLFHIWRNLPRIIEQAFKLNEGSFDIPCQVEIGYGSNLKDLTSIEEITSAD